MTHSIALRNVSSIAARASAPVSFGIDCGSALASSTIYARPAGSHRASNGRSTAAISEREGGSANMARRETTS